MSKKENKEQDVPIVNVDLDQDYRPNYMTGEEAKLKKLINEELYQKIVNPAPPPFVPNEEIKANALKKFNRMENKKGVYAKSLNTLRESDMNSSDIWKEIIPFIPNSRYNWFHKSLLRWNAGNSFTSAEKHFMLSFWMPKEFKDMINKMKTEPGDIGVKGIGYPKSGARPVYDSQNDKLYIVVNPNITNLNLPPDLEYHIKKGLNQSQYNELNNAIHKSLTERDEEIQKRERESLQQVQEANNEVTKVMTNAETIASRLQNKQYVSKLLKDAFDEIKERQKMELPDYMINPYLDKSLVKTLMQLRDAFETNSLTLERLSTFISELNRFHLASHNSYLAALLDPFTIRDAKIPNEIPLPTSSFKLKITTTLASNASGNLAFTLQPFYCNSVAGGSTFCFNNNVTLTGSAANNFFTSTDIGQCMTIALYQSYRLVSAGIKVTVTASANNASGYMTVGLDLSNTFYGGATGTVVPACQQYGQFSLIENLYYHNTAPATPGSTLYSRYFPKDESLTLFTGMGDAKPTAFVFYGTGLPPSSSCIKLDAVFNMEALVNPGSFDFIPSTFYTGSYDDMSSLRTSILLDNAITQQQPMTSIEKNYTPFMTKSVGNSLPEVTGKEPIIIPQSITKQKSFIDSVLDTTMSILNPVASMITSISESPYASKIGSALSSMIL